MSGETAGQVACIAWNAHYAEQHGIEARNEWAASDPRGRGAWEAAAQAGHKAIAAAAPAGVQDAPGAATRDQTADATAEGDDVPDEVRDLGRSLGASGWAKVPGPDGMELAVEAGWEAVRFDVTPAAPQPAPELAESSRYRNALENVFAVLDRQTLTYAERISRARTLIRAAQDGKS